MDSSEDNAAARETLAQAIDRRLPQTQCELCGHRGCLAYARAIAAGREEINRCPPGGAVTTDALARLLGRATPQPAAPPPPLQVARIREADCIGCALCIKACPVDCIVGAAKLMHSVIADECSGCELCLPACPTDCIEMTPRAAPQKQEQTQDAREAPSIWREFTQPQVEKWRLRAAQKRAREFLARRERATRGASGAGRRELRREILAAVRRKQAGAACRRA